MTIERAEMDGLNRTTLMFITAQLPRSLTLDVAARRLYWISVYKMVRYIWEKHKFGCQMLSLYLY